MILPVQNHARENAVVLGYFQLFLRAEWRPRGSRSMCNMGYLRCEINL